MRLVWLLSRASIDVSAPPYSRGFFKTARVKKLTKQKKENPHNPLLQTQHRECGHRPFSFHQSCFGTKALSVLCLGIPFCFPFMPKLSPSNSICSLSFLSLRWKPLKKKRFIYFIVWEYTVILFNWIPLQMVVSHHVVAGN